MWPVRFPRLICNVDYSTAFPNKAFYIRCIICLHSDCFHPTAGKTESGEDPREGPQLNPHVHSKPKPSGNPPFCVFPPWRQSESRPWGGEGRGFPSLPESTYRQSELVLPWDRMEPLSESHALWGRLSHLARLLDHYLHHDYGHHFFLAFVLYQAL